MNYTFNPLLSLRDYEELGDVTLDTFNPLLSLSDNPLFFEDGDVFHLSILF